MKIIVASVNPVKVEAVREVIKQYDFLKTAEIIAQATSSGVSEQPTSLEETIQGAYNRAKNAYNSEYAFSVGIESGLMEIPNSFPVDFCACVIFNGMYQSVGLSCGFEIPREVEKLVRIKNRDLNQACYEINLTQHEKIGSAEGIIGLLTKNRITRKDYTKQAVHMALIPWENQELYF